MGEGGPSAPPQLHCIMRAAPMRKYASLILLLPVLTFAAYLGYLYISRDGAAWNPLPALSRAGSPTEHGSPQLQLTTALLPITSTTTPAPSQPAVQLSPTPQATSTPTLAPTVKPTFTPSSTPTASPTATNPAALDEASAGIEVGGRIIEAIESYRAARGAYPIELSALVLDYFSAIPETPAGRPFAYRSFAADHIMASELYWLAFGLAEQPGIACTYYRRLEYWDCDAILPLTSP